MASGSGSRSGCLLLTLDGAERNERAKVSGVRLLDEGDAGVEARGSGLIICSTKYTSKRIQHGRGDEENELHDAKTQ